MEEKPEYPGGIDSLLSYIESSLNLNKGINGRIFIYFNVNCHGIACGFQTIKREGNITNDIELKIHSILENMQNWKPAQIRNKPVDCLYMISIKIIKGKIEFYN